MNDKVVFLAFRNEKIEPDGRDFLACKTCRNKTYVAIYHGEDVFPLLQCAACGNHIGHIGFSSAQDATPGDTNAT